MTSVSTMGNRLRPTACAGTFYHPDPEVLKRDVHRYLEDAVTPDDGFVCRAGIVPHAGLIYSGPIAGHLYRFIAQQTNPPERIVIIGPAHRIACTGIVAPSAHGFETPLGTTSLDRSCIEDLRQQGMVTHNDEAHAGEHCIEVQLPFLKVLYPHTPIVPLLVGHAGALSVAKLIKLLWECDDTLILISSDLSHFHSYSNAKRLDSRTSKAIVEKRYDALHPGSACGRIPISGMLMVSQDENLDIIALDLRNSGDTGGELDRVVGYGAYAIGYRGYS